MANILENYLDNLADAIRLKTGGTANIEAMDFASEIKSIPQNTTGIFQEKTVSLTTSGATEVTPDTNYDAMTKVTVTPKLQAKTVNLTSTGKTTITADSGNAGLSSVAVTPILQDKTLSMTSNTTTIITPDDNYAGLKNVTVTTNVSGGTLSVPAITNTNGDKLSKSLTLNANKTGVLVFHYVTALHWYYKISVAGTKIVERKGNQDVGVINTVASGWTSRYLHKGTGDGSSSEHTEILLIPASSSARTIAIEASSAYGGRFSWYTLIQ